MSTPTIYRLQSYEGQLEDQDFCEEYVKYYSNHEHIYLVSIEEDSRERFCRIKNKKHRKYIRYDDWEEWITYNNYEDEKMRVYKQLWPH